MSNDGTCDRRRLATICLLSSECNVCFNVARERNGYFHFDIEVEFTSLGASIPPVRRCAMSSNDVQRLVTELSTALAAQARDDTPTNGFREFCAYDAFFALQLFHDSSEVRVMLDYRPHHRCRVGVELRVQDEDLAAFRDGWAALIE